MDNNDTELNFRLRHFVKVYLIINFYFFFVSWN